MARMEKSSTLFNLLHLENAKPNLIEIIFTKYLN
jgi:hypothetical protein